MSKHKYKSHLSKYMSEMDLFSSLGPDVIARTHELEMTSSIPGGRESIHKALDQTVLLGGKRLRPLLTYLIANGLGLDLKEVDLFAKSIEKVHAASLAHDDVIDNASKRRGKDSINVVTSNKKAVLAGDYLLANVIDELVTYGNLKIVRETADVIKQLAEGEWYQLELISERSYAFDKIIEVANLKTSSVMKWCCVVPAIVAGLPENLVQMWREFGQHLGIAFQLVDDTLDFSGKKEKNELIDLENGIVSSVLFVWLRDNANFLQRFHSGESLFSIWAEASELEKEQLNLNAVREVKSMAVSHLDHCHAILDQIEEKIVNLSISEKHFAEKKKQIKSILNFLAHRQS